ncbi:hypothetical protein Tco_1316347 [Tanacetum coccineum]
MKNIPYSGSSYQKAPTSVKRIFRYLRGTINWGLWYSKDSAITLTAFADADHAGCQDTRRSTSGSMDKSKITRKQSKSSKYGHENQKSTKPKPKEAKPQPKP